MKTRRRAALGAPLLMALVSQHASVGAQSTPLPGSWGVNVHTAYHAPGLKSIGAQWVRLDMNWTSIEKDSRGHYDWSGADKLIGYDLSNGFHLIVVLGVAQLNPLYQSQAADKTAVIQAIARFGAAAAQHFKGKGILWEIANEPDVSPMNGYWNNATTYETMARLTAKGIKQADPTCKVAALAMGWMDRPFATAALKAGLLADGTIDYLSFHGYHRATIDPESGLADDIQWLRTQAANATPAGGTPPQVIDSETGYSLASPDAPKSMSDWRVGVLTEDTQAAYLARHYFVEISQAVPISVWYKDMFGENGFSLYYGDEKDPRGLRPMGRAFRTLANLLPASPAAMQNHQFTTSIKAKQDTSKGTPAPNLYVTGFLVNTPGRSQLIVALWNAVEAWDGKVLQSRSFTGTQVMEKWRAATSTDLVQVPVEVDINSLRATAVHSATVLSLPDGQVTGKVAVRALSSDGGIAFDATAQPTPIMISLDIDPVPGSPTDVRIK